MITSNLKTDVQMVKLHSRTKPVAGPSSQAHVGTTVVLDLNDSFLKKKKKPLHQSSVLDYIGHNDCEYFSRHVENITSNVEAT